MLKKNFQLKHIRYSQQHLDNMPMMHVFSVFTQTFIVSSG